MRLFSLPEGDFPADARTAILLAPFDLDFSGSIPSQPGYIESAVVALVLADATLSGLIGTRIKPHNVPQGVPGAATLPAVVYQLLDDAVDHHLDGPAGIARALLRLDALSRDYADCMAIAEALRSALDGYRGTSQGVAVLFAKLSPRASSYEPGTPGTDRGTHAKSSFYRFTYRLP